VGGKIHDLNHRICLDRYIHIKIMANNALMAITKMSMFSFIILSILGIIVAYFVLKGRKAL
jgi:hypothetical protein